MMAGLAVNINRGYHGSGIIVDCPGTVKTQNNSGQRFFHLCWKGIVLPESGNTSLIKEVVYETGVYWRNYGGSPMAINLARRSSITLRLLVRSRTNFFLAGGGKCWGMRQVTEFAGQYLHSCRMHRRLKGVLFGEHGCVKHRFRENHRRYEVLFLL